MERSSYWYIGSLQILTSTYTTALTTKQVARKVLFPSCLVEHILLLQIKIPYRKKTKVFKENWYQESIISKIFTRITNNYNLPQSQQLTQAIDIHEEEVRMSIYVPYVEGTSEKLQRILRSHKIGSTFYTENTLRKLLCKPKDWAATEDKSNFVYEINFSNCEAVYFGESKQSLKLCSDERKRSVRNCDCHKNEIAKSCWEGNHNLSWDQKKVINRGSRFIPRKIRAAIHSLKNPNHINKISYMVPEIWLPNLRFS